MKILGIETSCDETALAIIEVKGDLNNPKISIINEVMNSQVDIHKEYGGVFPALAKRAHIEKLPILLKQLIGLPELLPGVALAKSGVSWSYQIIKEDSEINSEGRADLEGPADVDFITEKPDIDFIAVTSGPGLEPCLWTGINFAQELSKQWNIPIMPIDHMEGHIASVLMDPRLRGDDNIDRDDNIDGDESLEFPILALLISGGHTELVYAEKWGEYKIVGKTLDDAVGEAYDKVARVLGLEYPGGPKVSKLAQEAREDLGKSQDKSGDDNKNIKLPRMMLNKSPDFSLSGLKTAVLYKAKEIGTLTEAQKKILAKEFEDSVVDLLLRKTKQAIELHKPKTFIAAGGVTANIYIKEKLTELCNEYGIEAIYPPQELSTDNAVMIAIAGFIKSFREKPSMDIEIKANGNMSLERDRIS